MRLLIVTALLLPILSFGQSSFFFPDFSDTNAYDREISLHEFISEALNEESDSYSIKNTKITRLPEIDDTSSLVGKGHKWIDIKVDISATNCAFDQVSFYNTRFKTIWLSSHENTLNSFNLISCELDRIHISTRRTADKGFGYLGIMDSKINGNVTLDQDFVSFYFNNNIFSKPVNYDSLHYKFDSFLDINWCEYQFVQIKNNTFPINDSLISISLATAKVGDLNISRNTLRSLDIGALTVSRSCTIDSTEISDEVLMGGVNLNPKSTNIPWFIFGGAKIQLREVNSGRRLDDINNVYMFNNLISEYKNFHNIYLTRGDIESANACFIEMKDIETQRMELLYRQDHSLSNWFNWRFNQFFKLFCNYGTSPVKALKISIYTILCFACVYFFFYSEWDKINRHFLITQHEKIMLYFKSNQDLEYEYLKRNRDEMKSYEKYKKEITKKTGRVPSYIRVLGRPLYFSAILKHRINLFLYRRTDILKSRWKDLSTPKRIFRGSLVGIGILFYLGYLVALRGVNSVFLSINAFSTLGFGRIPVHGLSKYITIIEGFTGWFLLSVFSISLIG